MLTNPLKDILDFFYPPSCAACGRPLQKGETLLCQDCVSRLAYSGYESWHANPIMENLSGRIPLYQAWALLDFKKQGLTQKLLHHLKYDHSPEIGVFLGRCIGKRCAAAGCLQTVDYAVPVPVHPKKQKKRGYNQALKILEGMAETLPGLKILPDLLTKAETQSQTKKGRSDRWTNIKDAFGLNPATAQTLPRRPLHILLVDDVITTGATLESCCRELMKLPDVKISVVAAASPI